MPEKNKTAKPATDKPEILSLRTNAAHLHDVIGKGEKLVLDGKTTGDHDVRLVLTIVK